jgi:hypothetical protein
MSRFLIALLSDDAFTIVVCLLALGIALLPCFLVASL